MKLIRVIPSLLIKDNILVKGKQFKEHKYVGDVFNAVKIFSEKRAHEIQLLDISARKKNTIIDINLIQKIRSEIFVPLSVGGGINNIEQISSLINEGVEKVVLNSCNYENTKLIEEAANKFGSQSVVVSIDVKKNAEGEYLIYSNNALNKINIDFKSFVKNCESMGAGEILLTSVAYEGQQKGIDTQLYLEVENLTNIPIVASGGVGSIEDITNLFDTTNLNAITCGAHFVFYGKRNAVLINYPSHDEIETLMQKYEKNN